MYSKDNTFKQIYNSILEFTNQLEEHVITTQQLNPDENLYRIYGNYEIELKNIFKNLENCKPEGKQCITNLKENFEKLRSDTAKIIEKYKT
jgi:hypothetical protein